MKKVVIAIIAMLYMGVSSGIAMEIHYCMGKKAGIEFYGDQDEKCGKCGMSSKKSGCCSGEHKFIKLSDAYKHVSNDGVSAVPDPVVLVSSLSFNEPLLTGTSINAYNNYSPPGDNRPAARILHGVFRL